MKTLPSCICILGLAAGTAMGGSAVLLDQIGPNDGSSIDATGGLASQYFEASFSIYDIAAIDDFDNSAGFSATSFSFVFNGGTDIAAVSGAQVNFYSAPEAAAITLAGDIASQDFVGAPTPDADWAGINFKVTYTADGFWPLVVGTNFGAVIPVNEFGVNSQTFSDASTIGDANCWQANPLDGFAFGGLQVAAANMAYAISGGTGDPCDLPLSQTCSGDVSGPNGVPDGFVSVDDVLVVIATFNECGDGTFRPQGDVAPLANGDCCVTVDDLLAVIEQYGADCRPRGACCFGVDGCNEFVPEEECDKSGGTWLGEDSNCDTCVSGACCLADGSCIQATPEDCSGNYQGNDSDCNDPAVNCVQAPANNECSGAIELFDGTTSLGGFSSATTTGAIIPDCGGVERQLFNDLYYSYTATCTGTVSFSTCGAADFDTLIAAYDACDGTVLGCNDDGADCPSAGTDFSSILDIEMTAGQTVKVRVGAFADLAGAPANANMTISCAIPVEGACCVDTDCIPLLPADCTAFGGDYIGGPCEADTCAIQGNLCEEAIAVSCNSATAYDSTNNFDSLYGEPDDTQCTGTYLDWTSSPDVWFTFTADEAGTVDVSLCDAAGYDTSLVLYSGSACGSLTQVACNGDASVESGCQQFYSGIYGQPVTAGETLYVRVGGWQGAQGAGTLTITCIGADATGACCLQDEVGTCVPDQTAAECAAATGTWSANQACADVTCATFIVCNGVGVGPTPESGAWTAGTSDIGADFQRAAAVAGVTSVSEVTVWGLPLAFNGTAFGACTDSGASINLFMGLSTEVPPSSGSFEVATTIVDPLVDTGILYNDAFPLVSWTFPSVGYSGSALNSLMVEGTSAAQGDCWFLWLSAEQGTSYANDGTGYIEETFAVAYCITE
jgi:hypothetical protein